ncbi:MAG: hypothetical protein HW385_1235, partial [candidate division NC10 bacterium]|nr:hypothetical protein [candidate division NC10 bacterium]
HFDRLSARPELAEGLALPLRGRSKRRPYG